MKINENNKLNRNNLDWVKWLEPLQYVMDKNSQELLSEISFTNLPKIIEKNQYLKILKKNIVDKKKVIKEIFFKSSDGTLYAGLNSIVTDNLISYIYDISTQNIIKNNNDNIALVATGGYGRGELAPHSDIDILFLLPDINNKQIKLVLEKKIETILYYLWDLGFNVGHSTRTVNELLKDCKNDQMFLTSLLESRFLIGNKNLFSIFKSKFENYIFKSNTLNFLKTKLNEAELRHKRYGSSRYVVEPNVKEGKGGIRDLHTLIWIAKHAYKATSVSDLLKKGALLKSELYSFADAHRFLLSVRCYLHLKIGRKDDNLTTDSQIEIAEKMKFRKISSQTSVERFMKRYFLAAKVVGNLTQIFCFAIEEDFKKSIRFNFFNKIKKNIPHPFNLKNKRIAIIKKDFFIDNPSNLIKIFNLSHFLNIDIHPKTIRFVADCTKLINRTSINDEQLNLMFLDILTSKDDPTDILRLMNDSNILGRLIPEFQKIVGLIQYDMYHYYTVDEHTIFTISNIHSVKKGYFKNISSFASEAISNVRSFKPLMVGMFLHDIAKGQDGDHSINGSEISKKICSRLGLNSYETEIVSWLVLNHLLLSKIAFRYDLTDNNIIDKCAKIIKTKEKLDLLLILTVCDIKAVGPDIWNDWKGALIHELYIKVREKILNESSVKVISHEKNLKEEKIYKFLKNKVWTNKKINKYIYHLNENYWKLFQFDTIQKHALNFNELCEKKEKLSIKIYNKTNLNLIELIVIAPDHHGLFSKISGIVSSCGFDIVTAKIFTRTDGYALDTFLIQYKNKNSIFEKKVQDNLISTLKSGLEGRYNYEKELKNRWQEIPTRFRKMKAPISVNFNNDTSSKYSVIEVNCKNSPGVLYIITKIFSELGMQVNTASISSYGNRAQDIFYISDLFGEKIKNDEKIREIKTLLLTNLKQIDPANEMV